jgi:UPF0716 protein FxsA
MWLLILFIAVPIIEIGLFIQVGGWLGFWPTIGIVILTALLGTTLLRSQGLAALGNLQNSVGAGQNPMNHIAHGALILVAGVVLLTPGFFTDAVGLSLLIPPVRELLIKAGAARMTGNIHVGGFQTEQTQRPASDDVFDADFTVVDDENQTRGNSGWTKGTIDKE